MANNLSHYQHFEYVYFPHRFTVCCQSEDQNDISDWDEDVSYIKFFYCL